MTVETLRRVDARGLACPMPIIRTARAIAEMESGELLEVLATDPGSVKDFQAFSKKTGNALLSSDAANSEFIFFMKKK